MKPVWLMKGALMVLATCVLGVVAVVPASANAFPFLVQTVMVAGGNVTPVNAGPFQDLITNLQNAGTIPKGQNFLPAGNPMAGTNVLPNRFAAGYFNARNFGSDGFAQGVYFQNLTGTTVDDIEVTMNNLTDTFAGSKGNADWNVTVTAPNAGTNTPATLTITATGAGLPKDASLWLAIPAAPKNSDATKPWQFTGKLTTKNPLGLGPALAPPTRLALGIGTGSGAGAVTASYNAGTGILNFPDSTINVAQYLDGSSTTTNGPTESIIGSTLHIDPTAFLGPDPTVPGAYDFADTLVQVSQGSTTFEDATLGDIVAYPGSSVSGDTSELFGTLTWQNVIPGLGSMYVDQDLSVSVEDGLYFDSNLIAATNGFTQDGSSSGPIEIASVSVLPEPSTGWLVVVGVLAALGRTGALRRRFRPRGQAES